jgi:intein/homing endonuclease
MKEPLTAEEKRAFEEISYAIGNRKAHPIEDIKGVAVPKHLIPAYMAIFVKKGYYDFDGKKYTLAKSGENDFRQKRDSDSRNVIPRISSF